MKQKSKCNENASLRREGDHSLRKLNVIEWFLGEYNFCFTKN